MLFLLSQRVGQVAPHVVPVLKSFLENAEAEVLLSLASVGKL